LYYNSRTARLDGNDPEMSVHDPHPVAVTELSLLTHNSSSLTVAPTPGKNIMDSSDYVFAGFWRRFWASVLDTALIWLIIGPILVGVYGWEYFTMDALIAGPIDFLVAWVLPSIAVILFWIYKAATPGKMAIGARIIAANGGRASNAQLIGRYFAYVLSALPLFVGFIWVAFDARKQGWHDKLAGTLVVRKEQQRPQPPSIEAS
jgi:uncharacterized RDD family membrane protein YckC